MSSTKPEKKTISKTEVKVEPKSAEQKVDVKDTKKTKTVSAPAKEQVAVVAPATKNVKEAKPKKDVKVEVKAEVKAEVKPEVKADAKKVKAVSAPVPTPKKKVVQAVEVEENIDNDDQDVGKRYFKCIQISLKTGKAICHGRYSGKKPKQAAIKACTRIYESMAEQGLAAPEQVIYGMHECTRSSKKKKKYFYVGKRVKLEVPVIITVHKVDPKTKQKTGEIVKVPYYYNNDVKKLTDFECAEYPLLCNYDLKEAEAQAEVEQIGNAKNAKKGKTAKGKSAGKAKTSKGKKATPKVKAAKVDAKVDTKVDAKTPAKVDTKTSAKVDAKPSAKVDTKAPAKEVKAEPAKAKTSTTKTAKPVEKVAEVKAKPVINKSANVNVKVNKKEDVKPVEAAKPKAVKTSTTAKKGKSE